MGYLNAMWEWRILYIITRDCNEGKAWDTQIQDM